MRHAPIEIAISNRHLDWQRLPVLIHAHEAGLGHRIIGNPTRAGVIRLTIWPLA